MCCDISVRKHLNDVSYISRILANNSPGVSIKQRTQASCLVPSIWMGLMQVSYTWQPFPKDPDPYSCHTCPREETVLTAVQPVRVQGENGTGCGSESIVLRVLRGTTPGRLRTGRATLGNMRTRRAAPGNMRAGRIVGGYSPTSWTSRISKAEIIYLQTNPSRIMRHHSCLPRLPGRPHTPLQSLTIPGHYAPFLAIPNLPSHPPSSHAVYPPFLN